MSTLYTISKDRAAEFLDLPEELPSVPAGYTGTRITGGKLGFEYEHNIEFRAPRRRALMIGRMLRTSAILSLAEEYLCGLVTKCKLSVKREELIAWLTNQEGDWLNLQVSEGRNGKYYAEVDTWKPKND